MEVTEVVKKKMAIKAHNDIMTMGQKLVDDPSCHPEMRELIKQEMENSKLCMDAFGLSEKVEP